MFLMIGISDGQKDFEYNRMIICNHCGAYGRYQVFVTFMCLSLFLIPCIKWNKQYFVRSSCCNALYALDPEIGKRIAKGEDIEILPEHLTLVQAGYKNQYGSRYKKCNNCGYATSDDFDYCPKCGTKFN